MKSADLPFMPKFYDRYINLVPTELSVLEALQQTEQILENHKKDLIELQDYRYQEKKWTCKEVVQHIIDNERIMSYRALALARGERQNLPGYEQDDYVNSCYANARSMESLLEEFMLVRKATILLFKSFKSDVLLNVGTCSNINLTPLALGLVCVGHTTHHIKVLKELYFNNI